MAQCWMVVVLQILSVLLGVCSLGGIIFIIEGATVYKSFSLPAVFFAASFGFTAWWVWP